MSVQTPPVAFSTAEPLCAPAAALRRRPARLALPVLVLLWPLPLFVAAAGRLVDGPAGAPLQIAQAGFPSASELLLQAPSTGDWRAFVALVVVGVATVATIVAAGLVGGAAAHASSVRESLALAARRWPGVAAVLFAQLVCLAMAATVVIAAAWLAGQVRFQLQTVVLLLGFGALGVVAIRASLWPGLVVGGGRRLLGSAASSWVLTRGSATRLVAAACGVAAVAAGLTAVLRWATTAVLTALADAGRIVASPVTIDLAALLWFPLGLLGAVAAWGYAATEFTAALERWSAASADAPRQPEAAG